MLRGDVGPAARQGTMFLLCSYSVTPREARYVPSADTDGTGRRGYPPKTRARSSATSPAFFRCCAIGLKRRGRGTSHKLENLVVAGELGFQPRLASPIKNHWPAVTSRAATAVVSAHCGPSLWTIQAAAVPKPPRAARASEGAPSCRSW